jgi:FixJ family two-component response regulator
MERTRGAVAGARIATVDDEAPVRVALARLLRLASYEVTGFESGEAFLASLATSCPDCVIVDIHMPGLNGFEVRERLRAGHADLPLVFISASDDAALDDAARAAGAVSLLRKPFSSDQLLAAVAAALAGRRSGRP